MDGKKKCLQSAEHWKRHVGELTESELTGEDLKQYWRGELIVKSLVLFKFYSCVLLWVLLPQVSFS